MSSLITLLTVHIGCTSATLECRSRIRRPGNKSSTSRSGSAEIEGYEALPGSLVCFSMLQAPKPTMGGHNIANRNTHSIVHYQLANRKQGNQEADRRNAKQVGLLQAQEASNGWFTMPSAFSYSPKALYRTNCPPRNHTKRHFQLSQGSLSRSNLQKNAVFHHLKCQQGPAGRRQRPKTGGWKQRQWYMYIKPVE